MIQVRIRTDEFSDEVLVLVIDKDTSESAPTYGRHRRILRYSDDGPPTWEDVAPGIEAAPTFRLSHDIARPLLDALHALYAGPSDTRTTRADLLHERGRVDKLIDAVISPQQVVVADQLQTRGNF